MIDLSEKKLVPPMSVHPISPPPRYVEKPHLDWPPGQAFPNEPLPPYPAGPNLSKIRYPRDVYSPKYMCPHCHEHFLFRRFHGVVLCPFCYNIVAVGAYNSRRCRLHLAGSALFLLLAAILLFVYIFLFDEQYYLIMAVCVSLIWCVVCAVRAAHSRHCFEEAEMVEEEF